MVLVNQKDRSRPTEAGAPPASPGNVPSNCSIPRVTCATAVSAVFLRQQRLNTRALIRRINLRAIAPRAAIEHVDHAIARLEAIIAALALELIRSAAAVERVVAVATLKGVV